MPKDAFTFEEYDVLRDHIHTFEDEELKTYWLNALFRVFYG